MYFFLFMCMKNSYHSINSGYGFLNITAFTQQSINLLIYTSMHFSDRIILRSNACLLSRIQKLYFKKCMKYEI